MNKMGRADEHATQLDSAVATIQSSQVLLSVYPVAMASCLTGGVGAAWVSDRVPSSSTVTTVILAWTGAEVTLVDVFCFSIIGAGKKLIFNNPIASLPD